MMMKSLSTLALSLSLFAPCLPAAAFDTGLDAFISGLEGITVPPATVTAVKAPAMAEWTVMVFVNGKNDLASFGKADLNEMEEAGSTSRVNVVAELGVFKEGVKRYFVTRDEDPSRITSPVVKDLGSPDMGSWEELADFSLWARENYPARRYMLIVWNHGSGWVTDKPPSKGISYDDETGNHISTPELRKAMEKAGKIDILAMDACLMQMMEVAYEVKDLAGLIVASEETEPGEGYPYGEMLKTIDSLAARTSEKVARGMVKDYGDFYSKTSRRATQSAVRTAALPGLAVLLDSWAEAALSFPAKDKLRKAGNGAAFYAIDEYKDLPDFMTKAALESGDPVLAERGRAIAAYISKNVVAANYSSAAMPAGSNGLSIYVPRSPTSPRYKALRFAADTRWDEFVDSLPRYTPPASGGCVNPGPWASPEEQEEYFDCVMLLYRR